MKHTLIALAVAVGWAHGADTGTGSGETGSFQRDREAILGMVGKFRVEFNFRETVSLVDGYELQEAYHEEAMELVKLVEDRGDLIVLQHLLLVDDGLEVMVVKHWGQIWKYEDPEVLHYQGGREWEKRVLPAEEIKGKWTQLVTQTDDSPRYESWGTWEHVGNRSAWQSEVTHRPLPRREYKKRSDYDLLVAVNRHVLTPQGWVHEQDNRKWNIADRTFLAHEAGLNRYVRCDEDFSRAEEQWERTKGFWHDVRMAWAGVINGNDRIAYREEIDGTSLSRRMNRLAKQVTDGGELDEDAVETLLEQFTEPSE